MWLLLLACRPDEPVVATGPGVTEALREGLEGFEVTEGVSRWTNASFCEDATCAGNNPLSPYALFGFDGLAEVPAYQLGPDEVLLIVGRTPPGARYFSFGQYIHRRFREDGAGLDVRGSISPFLNPYTLAVPSGAFDAPVVLLASPNASVQEAVVQALTAPLAVHGLGSTGVNALPIPWLSDAEGEALKLDPAYADDFVVPFHLGHEARSDIYSATLRVAVPDDLESSYFRDDTFAVFHIRQLEPSPVVSWAYPHLPPDPRVGHRLPEGLEQAVSLTASAIETAVLVSGLEATSGPLEPYRKHGFQCIAMGERCAGNNDDSRYWIAPGFRLQERSGSGVVVVGAIPTEVAARHDEAPEVAYHSLTVKNSSTQVGIEALLDEELVGSFAARFPDGLPGVGASLAELIYVVRIARDCEDAAFCMEVPFEGELSALATERLGISERSTLNPVSRTAPAADAVVVPIAVGFGPDVRRVDGVWLLD